MDIAVDSQGRLHVVANAISFADAGMDYGVRETDGGWTVTRILAPVSSVAGTGTGSKILLDSSGRPHIAYTHQDLTSAPSRARLFLKIRQDDAGWQTEEVEDAGFQVGVRFGFELDSQGTAHLGYYLRNTVFPDGGQSLVVRYATRTAAGSWSHELVEQSRNVGSFGTGLALDSTGSPHLFYQAEPVDGGVTSSLKHAGKSGGNWLAEEVSAYSIPNGWAASSGNDLYLLAAGTLYRKSGASWTTSLGATAPNGCVLKTAPNGAVWGLSHSGSSSGRKLNILRAVKEVINWSDADGGLSDVRYSGMAFGPGGELWGVSHVGTLPYGIYVYRVR